MSTLLVINNNKNKCFFCFILSIKQKEIPYISIEYLKEVTYNLILFKSLPVISLVFLYLSLSTLFNTCIYQYPERIKPFPNNPNPFPCRSWHPAPTTQRFTLQIPPFPSLLKATTPHFLLQPQTIPFVFDNNFRSISSGFVFIPFM
jgi:hypothetical protein